MTDKFAQLHRNVDPLPLKAPANASVPHAELFYNRMNWSVASSKTIGQGNDHCCRRVLGDQDTDTLTTAESDGEAAEDSVSAAAGASGFSAVCWFAAVSDNVVHQGALMRLQIASLSLTQLPLFLPCVTWQTHCRS